MKRLSLFTKILLSIPFVVSIAYAIIQFFLYIPFSFLDERTHFGLMALNLIVLGYLIYRIFNFKKIPKETKFLWTALWIFISPSVLYYIWIVDDKKVAEDRN